MALTLAIGLSAAVIPLQIINEFLNNFNVGQVLLLVFVLAILGTLPLKSMKIVSINLILFGLVFLVTPIDVAPVHYRFLGIALLVIGPMLLVSARS